jgi:hypothetical protein
MSIAIERIVVQATPEDKRSIVDKARRLDIPVSELMRRSALAYEAATDEDLEALADAARRAADRAGSAIDDALAFIEASNRRLAVMEPAARYAGDRVAASGESRGSAAVVSARAGARRAEGPKQSRAFGKAASSRTTARTPRKA